MLAMPYRVVIEAEGTSTTDVIAQDWPAVRAAVGDGVEAALSRVPDVQRADAYVMDVPQVNRLLTGTQVRETVDTRGSYRAAFIAAPVTVTITGEDS